MIPSRRRFLKLGALAPAASVSFAAPSAQPAGVPNETMPLDGEWLFRLDAQNEGEGQAWYGADANPRGWRTVTVPHTWQIEPENTEYMGVAWYRRHFYAPQRWAAAAVRVEFEAVFHSATVWLNGHQVGRHIGKGYTAFLLDLSSHLRPAGINVIVVRVDNSFLDSMLPRGKSSDWAHDGGIYRPVRILVTPKTFIERIAVDAEPDLGSGNATVKITAVVRNTSAVAWEGAITGRLEAEAGAAPLIVQAAIQIGPAERKSFTLPEVRVEHAKLWHFDHPYLHQLTSELSNGHVAATTFGIRKIETRDAAFFLNGERVRLMGTERMAGSNPEYGMAEPMHWVDHDHRDLKELNCVYTRVHWPQDKQLLDWCDRQGILIQTEVPTWGPKTFAGMGQEPSAEIMDNGLEQLREMVERDRNHPCIFSWGVCNEVGGQNAPAYAFAKRMYEEAKRLDPQRLVTYASNSLQTMPENDVSGVMDYIMWNEYYESWYKGTPADLGRNLDEIHRAFPNKAIVISEYGYCACTPDRPEGDGRRAGILRQHDAIFRERDYVAGLIFFCYNDYRTHIGDRGTGALKQRVHGVVGLYGEKKSSWDALRRESSPIASLEVSGTPGALAVAVTARATVPAYPLRAYEIRGVAYGFGQIPVERCAVTLKDLAPGETARVQLTFKQKDILRIHVDAMRPTGFSAWTEVWQY